MREDFLGRFYPEKSASFDPLKASIPPIPGKSASLNSRLVIIIPGILPSTPSGRAGTGSEERSFMYWRGGGMDADRASHRDVYKLQSSLNSRLVIFIPGILPSTPSGPAELLKISPGDFFSCRERIPIAGRAGS